MVQVYITPLPDNNQPQIISNKKTGDKASPALNIISNPLQPTQFHK